MEQDQQIVDFLKKNTNQNVHERIAYDRTSPLIGEKNETIGLVFVTPKDGTVDTETYAAKAEAFGWAALGRLKEAWHKINRK